MEQDKSLRQSFEQDNHFGFGKKLQGLDTSIDGEKIPSIY
jgi:hypothetical protein